MTTNSSESPFKVGTKIAIIRVGSFGTRTINPGTVIKVRKDGKFFIRYEHGAEPEYMFKPLKWGGNDWRGECSGFARPHIRVWNASIETEIAEKQAERDAAAAQTKLSGKINELHVRSPADRATIYHLLALIEGAYQG